jgi:uncharacterized protein
VFWLCCAYNSSSVIVCHWLAIGHSRNDLVTPITIRRDVSLLRQVVDLIQLISRAAGALRARAISVKNMLRRYLIRNFPVTYDILFTSGNFDETPGVLIREHREFVHMMSQPGLRDLMAHHPPIVYRPYRRYLAIGFKKRDRRTILKHHYGYLLAAASETFFCGIVRNKFLLWQQAVGENMLTIQLSFNGELHHEGDLLLDFQENSLRLYHLSFTVAPGYLTGSSAAHVILVGHVLGIAGRFEAIRRATKACRDIAPPYMLMAALQGLAGALNVDILAGVKNSEQITANSDDSKNVYFDYDAFWRTHLGIEGEKFFLISVPVAEKPLALISASHRRRTRLKREFKNGVGEAAKAAFEAALGMRNAGQFSTDETSCQITWIK